MVMQHVSLVTIKGLEGKRRGGRKRKGPVKDKIFANMNSLAKYISVNLLNKH